MSRTVGSRLFLPWEPDRGVRVGATTVCGRTTNSPFTFIAPAITGFQCSKASSASFAMKPATISGGAASGTVVSSGGVLYDVSGSTTTAITVAYGATTKSCSSPRFRPRPGTPNAMYW